MPRYDQVRFLSTHNSYSGNQAGERGSIRAQLEAGIRCFELDFHDNGYAHPQIQDYRLGHGLGPGSEVDHTGGNPRGVKLREWIGILTAWSASRTAPHAPITLVLDSRDDLTDNDKGGDPADLNRTLKQAFGASLFTRAEFDAHGQWPDWTRLRGRFVCVLSGNAHTRGCYRWDFGAEPALGVNAAGDVVVAFVEESGDVYCWRGVGDPTTGAIEWLKRSLFERSNVGIREPALAIRDDGWVVAACRFDRALPDTLVRRLGHLGERGRINWFQSKPFAVGRAPSLEIHGDRVTEIHDAVSGGRQRITGTLDTAGRRIEWGRARATSDPRFTVDIAQWGTHTLACTAHRTKDWLGTRFDDGDLQPLRFEQLAFVEMQKQSEAPTLIDPLFFAAPAHDKPAIAQARRQRPPMVARAYGFADGDRTHPWVENMPATDTPNAGFYVVYSEGPDFAV